MMFGQPSSWPEFVGRDADQVANELRAQGFEPDIKAEGAPCTRDYRMNRVRLFVDANNKITQTPCTG